MKGILSKIFRSDKQASYHIIVKTLSSQVKIPFKQGQNLMDVTNKIINEETNIYGLCDKQLACTTCSVRLKTKYDLLPQPSEQQNDILYALRDFNQGQSRMACQIHLTKNLNGMIVQINKQNSIL